MGVSRGQGNISKICRTSFQTAERTEKQVEVCWGILWKYIKTTYDEVSTHTATQVNIHVCCKKKIIKSCLTLLKSRFQFPTAIVGVDADQNMESKPQENVFFVFFRKTKNRNEG